MKFIATVIVVLTFIPFVVLAVVSFQMGRNFEARSHTACK